MSKTLSELAAEWAKLPPAEKQARRDDNDAETSQRLVGEAARIQSEFVAAMEKAEQYVPELRAPHVEEALAKAVSERDQLRSHAAKYIEQMESVRDDEYRQGLAPVESKLDLAKAGAIMDSLRAQYGSAKDVSLGRIQADLDRARVTNDPELRYALVNVLPAYLDTYAAAKRASDDQGMRDVREQFRALQRDSEVGTRQAEARREQRTLEIQQFEAHVRRLDGWVDPALAEYQQAQADTAKAEATAEHRARRAALNGRTNYPDVADPGVNRRGGGGVFVSRRGIVQ